MKGQRVFRTCEKVRTQAISGAFLKASVGITGYVENTDNLDPPFGRGVSADRPRYDE